MPSLWIAPLSGRTYAIPPEARLAPGEALICAVDGELRRVDERALAGHAVPEAVMRARYRAELERGGEVAGQAARAAWTRLVTALPGLEAALDALGEGETPDGAALLAALTGRSVAAVRVDPAGARQAVEEAVAGFAAAPITAVGRDEAVEPTTAELDALAVHLGRWLGGAGRAVESAPAAELRARARRLFEALPRPAPGRPDPLRRMLGAINALYIAAADDPLTASGRARQQARFRADARARIDEATRDWKPPMPTFDALLKRGPR